jgi:hypothetical protein
MNLMFYFLLQINKELHFSSISQFQMNWLRKKNHFIVDVKEWGFFFAKCIICDSLKDLLSKARKNNPNVKEYEMKLRKHNIHQESCRHFYHTWKVESVQFKEEFWV